MIYHESALMLKDDSPDFSRPKSRIVIKLKSSVNDFSVGAYAAWFSIFDSQKNEEQNNTHHFENFFETVNNVIRLKKYT